MPLGGCPDLSCSIGTFSSIEAPKYRISSTGKMSFHCSPGQGSPLVLITDAVIGPTQQNFRSISMTSPAASIKGSNFGTHGVDIEACFKQKLDCGSMSVFAAHINAFHCLSSRESGSALRFNMISAWVCPLLAAKINFSEADNCPLRTDQFTRHRSHIHVAPAKRSLISRKLLISKATVQFRDGLLRRQASMGFRADFRAAISIFFRIRFTSPRLPATVASWRHSGPDDPGD